MTARAFARSFERLSLKSWGLSALGAALLMWTAVINGRPPVFTDTALYYAQGEYLFEALHVVSPAHAVSPPNDPSALPSTPGAPSVTAAIDGARSPLYGAAIYALQRLGGLWLAAFVQAWAAAGMIYWLCRTAAPRAGAAGYLALMAGLAALSPLPFFASWIMPDVFAGVAGCGLMLILVYADRLGAARLAAVCVMTGFGLAVHRSNLLDAVAVTGGAALLLALAGLERRRLLGRLALILALGVGAAAAGALVYVPIRTKAGEPIGAPPFLSARVLADGPGRVFLRQTCAGPHPRFVLCAFKTRPMATSDQILWSHAPRTAVFLAADLPTRLVMERQDFSFAEAEVRTAPWRQAQASAWNALQQLVMADVEDPLKPQGFYVVNPYWRRTSLPRIIPNAGRCRAPGACGPRVGERTSLLLEGVGLGLSLLILTWRVSAPDIRAILGRRAAAGWRDERVRLLTASGLVVVLLLGNAVVCGALSGPFPRYQARIVWLLPMIAALWVLGAGWRRLRAGVSL